MSQRRRLLLAIAAASVLAIGLAARADDGAATQPASQNLHIVVTNVQGQAEVKLTPDSKWQRIDKGMDLIVGCQIRTGIPGNVQFMVGEDEVYRVDRLSLVQVVQADESKGKIKTVVGMTYGRVSKDVDAPVVPHDDTIVSPSSTLATRGTRVSLYDQPPYAPEAVSLTGTAIFRNLHAQLVQLGAKNAGTAKVDGDSDSPAQFQEDFATIDPQGAFSARTGAEQQAQITAPAGPPPISPSLIVAPAEMAGITAGFPNPNAVAIRQALGKMQFALMWTGLTADTIVKFSVRDPSNEVVSRGNPFSPDGGIFLTEAAFSQTANSMGAGLEEITFGNTGLGMFPVGVYTITETLKGTTSEPLSANQPLEISTTILANRQKTEKLADGKSTLVRMDADAAHVELTNQAPTATFTVVAPVTKGERINPAPNSGH